MKVSDVLIIAAVLAVGIVVIRSRMAQPGGLVYVRDVGLVGPSGQVM